MSVCLFFLKLANNKPICIWGKFGDLDNTVYFKLIIPFSESLQGHTLSPSLLNSFHLPFPFFFLLPDSLVVAEAINCLTSIFNTEKGRELESKKVI